MAPSSLQLVGGIEHRRRDGRARRGRRRRPCRSARAAAGCAPGSRSRRRPASGRAAPRCRHRAGCGLRPARASAICMLLSSAGNCWRRSARRLGRVGHRHAAVHRRHRRRLDHAAQELLAQQQRVGRDPALAAGPALDVGRIERHLAQPLHHAHELRLLRHRQAEHMDGADDQLDRRLDQRAAVGGIAELRPTAGSSASAA